MTTKEEAVEREAKFPIGQQFMTRGKHPKRCTVIDILKTYNSAGELVAIRYVATHEFSGQTITDSDVPETTIAMGLLSEPHPCPACGRNPDDREPRLTLRELMAGWSFTFNPGGGEFNRLGHRRVQISVQCNWCDLQEAQEQLAGAQ